MIRRILTVAACTTLLVLAPVAPHANAHVTNDPYVHPAWYDNSGVVNFHVGPQIDEVQFRDAVQNIDNRLNQLPDLHVRSCAGNPGKCVQVSQVTQCGSRCGLIVVNHYKLAFDDTLKFRRHSLVPQKLACRGVLFVMGMHPHNGNGCLNYGPGIYTDLESDPEAAEMNRKYADSSGREIPSDTDYGEDEIGDGIPEGARTTREATVGSVRHSDDWHTRMTGDPKRTAGESQRRFNKMRPCAQEDGVLCVWDAVHLGNGLGHSFWAHKQRGVQTRYSHKVAHRLIYGKWRTAGPRFLGDRVDLVHGGTRLVTRHSLVSVGDTTYIVWRGVKGPKAFDVGTS